MYEFCADICLHLRHIPSRGVATSYGNSMLTWIFKARSMPGGFWPSFVAGCKVDKLLAKEARLSRWETKQGPRSEEGTGSCTVFPRGPASYRSRSGRGLGSLAQNTAFHAGGRRESELGLRQGRTCRNLRRQTGREGDSD